METWVRFVMTCLVQTGLFEEGDWIDRWLIFTQLLYPSRLRVAFLPGGNRFDK
jgi:hypothetical protein